ncbi:hypothetical protein ACTHGC_003640 [Vibrio parahaemolyticus]|uniref:hypothetical protein n=1 Tax=Vibrio parahaemolyticus TaxID=670 RepID=UPI001112F056|nr:hypothetical protein [Vibrio parahaemolyticus]EGQ9247195.1 hypothetical protein [Vibrio parahaemolyticus]EJU9837108.1 hypothetical protein [Vibrio parahaemolyticus]EKO5217491.1 hypothetical protein [Vibrio parahaemolyticus]HCH1030969.1 hypothetical protein [Vibrio parahaemolyticus]
MYKKWWPTSLPDRLFNLALLLDAVVLYDELCILSAELPPDSKYLSLRNFLLNEGIVHEIDTSSLSGEVSSEIGGWLRSANFERPEHVELADELQEATACWLSADTNSNSEEDKRNAILRLLAGNSDGTVSHWWLEERQDELSKSLFQTLGSHVLDNVSYLGSGTVVGGVSHLRTLVYWRVAEHYKISFMPCARRLPQLDAIYGRTRANVQQQIIGAVARSFDVTLDEIRADSLHEIPTMPPLLAIFLDRVREKDVMHSIISMREEFAPLRKALCILEGELAQCHSIRDRLSAQRRFKVALDGLTATYRPRTDILLEETISYAPDIVKQLSNPFDLDSFTETLLKRPASWVKDWWIRRPYRLAYRIPDLLMQVQSYEQLTADALGIELKNEDSEAFYARYERCLKLYEKEVPS